MANTPFKNRINEKAICAIADHLIAQYPAFDKDGFVNMATDQLETLELKQRTVQLTAALKVYLPKNFPQAVDIILRCLGPALGKRITGDEMNSNLSHDQNTHAGIRGWPLMALADYVAQCGEGHFELSLDVLQAITRRGSAEFAIRFFLEREQNKTLAVLLNWVAHPDHHVRRLVSEGTRPLLPWGFQLTAFRQNPQLGLQLLEALKDDESEYVRRSVANHLNDIAKDHPDLIATTAARWLNGADQNRKRLVRHACRTLLKQDHPAVLALFGYAKPEFESCSLVLQNKSQVSVGDSLPMLFSFKTLPSVGEQKLMIDYCVHHQKANGQTAPKVFKWRLIAVKAGTSYTLEKNHSLKLVTTRRYYPGSHSVEIKVNGHIMASASFQLRL